MTFYDTTKIHNAYIHLLGRSGTIWTDAAINNALNTSPSLVTLSDDAYRLPEELADIKNDEVSALQETHPNLFNGVSTCLVSPSSHLRGGGDIVIQPVTYFDGIASNQAWTQPRHRAVLRPYTLDHRGQLLPENESRLANGIGVSCLLVTSDDRIVFTVQGESMPSPRDSVGATGSGSLPWDPAIPSGTPFTDIIRAGMLTEAYEESRIVPETVTTLALTSYFRWKARGGKPEFTGLGRTSLSWDDIAGESVDEEEKHFTSGIISIDGKSLTRSSSRNRTPDEEVAHLLELLSLDPSTRLPLSTVASWCAAVDYIRSGHSF